MANEHLFSPNLSVASARLAAQSDPNASIGGFASSTPIADHAVETITHTVDQREFRAAGLPASLDLVGAWIVFLDSNLNEAREIIAYQPGAPRRITVGGEELPNTILVSDRFSIYQPNAWFSSMDGDLCRRRATVHRLGYMLNSTGATLDDCRIYVKDIKPGPLSCAATMAAENFPLNSAEDVDVLASEEAVPPLNQTSGFGDQGQELLTARDWTRATRTPYATPGASQQASIRDVAAVFHERAMWVRLSYAVDAPIPRATQSVFQVFIDSGDGATNTSFLVVVDIDGVPEEISAVVDRRLRIAGGARVSCIVRDSVVPNEAVPGATIEISLDSGPGTLNAQSDTVQREDGVPIRRVYLSPTDPGQVGVGVDFRFEVT